MVPLQEQTWESFSQNWNVDVAQAFHWTRYALRRPLAPGSAVIAVSSGAAVNGSPLQRWLRGGEGHRQVHRQLCRHGVAARRAGHPRSSSVLPQLTPATDLGAKAVAAYAELQGVDVETFVASSGPALSAEQVGKSILEIAGGARREHFAYLLTASALTELA